MKFSSHAQILHWFVNYKSELMDGYQFIGSPDLSAPMAGKSYKTPTIDIQIAQNAILGKLCMDFVKGVKFRSEKKSMLNLFFDTESARKERIIATKGEDLVDQKRNYNKSRSRLITRMANEMSNSCVFDVFIR